MTPTLADVNRVAALSDPIIRNLQITQCYHELSAAFAARTGPQALIYLVFTSLLFNLLAFVAMLRLRQPAPDRAAAAIE